MSARAPDFTGGPAVRITGIAAVSALGASAEAQLAELAAGRAGLRTLADFPGRLPERWHGLRGGWLPERERWLRGRRYGAAANAALAVARLAVQDAGWDDRMLADCWIFGGSSRANTGELFGLHDFRRPVRKFQASNTMHSEMAAAVSIGLGIQGPWQMLANGCAAGLDAVGMAWAALRAGLTERALVVSVELPLAPVLLEGFSATGLLAAADGEADPFDPAARGFHPAEAAVALALETGGPADAPAVLWYGANSDAYDHVAVPPDAAPLRRLFARAREVAGPALAAVCPHANGTPANAAAERMALAELAGDAELPLVLAKAATGHSLGASGALETALLAAALRRGRLPANVPGLTAPGKNLSVPDGELPLVSGAVVLNSAISMGGHNAALLLRAG